MVPKAAPKEKLACSFSWHHFSFSKLVYYTKIYLSVLPQALRITSVRFEIVLHSFDVVMFRSNLRGLDISYDFLKLK